MNINNNIMFHVKHNKKNQTIVKKTI